MDQYPNSQPEHSSMLSFSLSFCVWSLFYCPLWFSLFCSYSVVGNPLICGSSSTEGCSGSAPVPLSLSLKPSPGKPYTLSFSVFTLYTRKYLFLSDFFIIYIHPLRKTQVQDSSNCTWGQLQLCLSHAPITWNPLVQKEAEEPNHSEHQWSVSS